MPPKFAPPPSLFDESSTLGDDLPTTTTSSSTAGGPATRAPDKGTPLEEGNSRTGTPTTATPVETSRVVTRYDRCKNILMKHPIELYDVRSVAREGIPDNLRAIYWRVMLGFLPTHSEKWPTARAEAQKTYEDLLQSVLNVKVTEEPALGTAQFRRVDVDIPRTMPALHFFACEEIEYKDGIPISFSPNQNSLRRILQLYSTLNPGIGYVQGMNEIAGHMLYTFATSMDESVLPFTDRQRELLLQTVAALDSDEAKTEASGAAESTNDAESAKGDKNTTIENEKQTMTTSFTSAFDRSSRTAGGDGASIAVEAEVFFCLQTMTAYVGDTFCRALDADQAGVTGAMATFGTLLYFCDRELADHLEGISLQPTFYAFRWITVLLTQEFLLPEVLRIWDFLLSFGNDLRAALFYTAVGMLILARDEVLKCGFTEAMPLLQNYPAPDDIHQLTDVVEQLIATQGLNLVEKIQNGEVSKAGDGDDEEGGSNLNEKMQETARAAQASMKGWLGRMSVSISKIGRGGDGSGGSGSPSASSPAGL